MFDLKCNLAEQSHKWQRTRTIPSKCEIRFAVRQYPENSGWHPAVLFRFEIGKLNNDSLLTFQNPYTHAPQAPILDYNDMDGFHHVCQYKPDTGQIESYRSR